MSDVANDPALVIPAGTVIKWVQVSTKLLAELGEWSEPVRVKVVSETDGFLEMVFQRPLGYRVRLMGVTSELDPRDVTGVYSADSP